MKTYLLIPEMDYKNLTSNTTHNKNSIKNEKQSIFDEFKNRPELALRLLSSITDLYNNMNKNSKANLKSNVFNQKSVRKL